MYKLLGVSPLLPHVIVAFPVLRAPRARLNSIVARRAANIRAATTRGNEVGVCLGIDGAIPYTEFSRGLSISGSKT